MTQTARPDLDLTAYDVVLLNSSAGKDSQAMLTLMVAEAERQGVKDRIVVVHADLGRAEWTGTRELAETQAAAYGLRFEVVARPQGDLLAQIEARGMFPSSTARYCTSDQKTGQVARLLTSLTAELALDRPARILNCLGIRAQESAARAKKPVLSADKRASNGKRHVDRYLPIFALDVEEVWEVIRVSGLPHHPAYDAGMPRLSCVFCVLASKSALVLAAKLNPGLAEDYRAVEVAIGHRFRQDLSMGDIIAEAACSEPVAAADWNA